MAGILNIPSDAIVLVLSYLRSSEISNACLSNKFVFSPERAAIAIADLMKRNVPITISNSHRKQLQLSSNCFNPSGLFVFEVTCILNALCQPQPLPGKGYWLSTSWYANTKRYLEGLRLPELQATRGTVILSSSTRRSKTGRSRARSSDVPPPSGHINADILCPHGRLSTNSRYRSIDSRAWATLRKYYPEGPEFKCSQAMVCQQCSELILEAQQSLEDRTQQELNNRKRSFLPDSLQALYERKCGVPEHCIQKPWTILDENPTEELSEQAIQVLLGESFQPLRPGLYNLVPRDWLRRWRRFIRDPTMDRLQALDCSRLLCYSHGYLLVPNHLEEFLLGIRKTLVGGLGAYEGEVVELVTAEEFAALQAINKGHADFEVRCALDGEGVAWSVPVCMKCDPSSEYNYGESMKNLAARAALHRIRQGSQRLL